MAADRKVVVWSKQGCHFCNEVKEYLEKHQIPYENISVDGNDSLRDVLQAKYSIRHVPVVEVGTGTSYVAWVDLQLGRLESLLAVTATEKA
ncbi:glutaredoxin family protein [Brevibacillus ruminantium]|uniref:Glutaredoxin family protein n=1 Tax=Brevibacillus ruminantium TaxID=2950604 RepID=A0ABY4WIF1_9BACL|nr:glutaredoxin family protein [Brevibacillus ruminantium]USG66877.1 glutaredoxin family protein [Brevibacillus ruminantium]